MRTLGALVAAALALTLVACGSDDGPRPGSPGPGDRNNADELFVEVASGSAGTLRQIADLADQSAESDELEDLAEEMVDELTVVGDRLEELADEWDLPEAVSGSTGSLPAQEQSEDWKRLQELEGPEFDALWVNVVAESLAAVQGSADRVVERGQDADLRELATDLAQDCADWIDELEILRG